jgi:hypothetical protein
MMVLPTIKGETEKIVTMAQLKHSYSTLQNAIRMSEYHNGKIKRWQIPMAGKAFFDKYFKNYLKYTTEISTTDLRNAYPRTYLNGTKYTGTTYSVWDANRSHHVLLLNGSMITFNWSDYHDWQMWIGIDVNGINPPNRIGRDTFLFTLTNDYGLQPLGGPGTVDGTQANGVDYTYGPEYNRNYVMNANKRFACNREQQGYWCTALVMNDGWKISKDYPWSKVKKHQKEKKH